MEGGELLHGSAHVVEADGIDRRHADPAGDLLVERPDLVLERVIPSNQFTAAVEENLPFAGGQQGALRSLDELHSQPVFELADDLTGPRLRNPLSSAAREKLRRTTMSQKILSDLRFMSAAADWPQFQSDAVGGRPARDRSCDAPFGAADDRPRHEKNR